MFQCLLSDDAASLDVCLNTFKNNEFFKTAKREINSMHPVLALKTLQKFGFRTEYVNDSLGGKLRKVQSVDSWMKTYMKETFNPSQIQQITDGNDRLIAYLDLVSQYINANPGILNKGYGGTSAEASGLFKPSDYVRSVGIPADKWL